MFAIKKANGFYNPKRFTTREEAEAAFNPTPFGDVEIVEVVKTQSAPEDAIEIRADLAFMFLI